MIRGDIEHCDVLQLGRHWKRLPTSDRCLIRARRNVAPCVEVHARTVGEKWDDLGETIIGDRSCVENSWGRNRESEQKCRYRNNQKAGSREQPSYFALWLLHWYGMR